MRSWTQRLFDKIRTPFSKRKSDRRTRLQIELLEERAVPATDSGLVSGVAFLDANGSGLFDGNDVLLPGVQVRLTGTTSAQGLAVDATAATDSAGAFKFLNVLPGTYSLNFGPVEALSNSSGSISGVNVAAGQTTVQNVGLRGGLDANFITMLMFTTETTSSVFPFTGGSGQALANFRENNTPTVKTAIAEFSVAQNAADTTFNLAGRFTDADFTNSQVTFNITNNGTQTAIPVELFDTTAPQTVANFFNYVNNGDYTNSIFHRLESTFVIQGGALKLNGNNVIDVPVHDLNVPNEFGASNTLGTLAMAQSAGDPNSADSQFFFNLANNSSALDPQDFTVFGRMLDNTDFDTLKTSPVIDLSAGNTTTAFEAAHPSALMSSVPMANYTGNVNTFPGDAVAANFMVINSITVDRRDEFLTYSVVSNSNPGVVTASIDTDAKEQLRLDYTQDGHGAATIVVRATDRFGAFVDMSFRVIVGNNAPTANVTLTPSAAAASDATLTADVVANDADSDPVTLTYRWFLGGTLVKTTSNTTSTSDTLNLTTLTGVDPGDLIEVQVTPNDGFVNGTNAIDTLNVNRAPTFDATPVFTPSNPTATEPVTVSSPATDSDGGDVVKYSYDWAVDGTSVRTVTDTLLSSDTLNLSLVTGVQSGDVINVTIIASDGKNGGSTTTTAQTTVL